jgi:hypothetical protein
MYAGLWNIGLKSLKSLSEWMGFLLLVGFVLALGYLCMRSFGNPLTGLGVNRFLVFAVLFVASGSVTSQMRNQSLQMPDISPYGIISFELVKTPSQAEKLANEWKNRDVVVKEKKIKAADQARKELYLDFPFIFFYVTIAALLCFWFAEKTEYAPLASVALLLGWSAPFAGILDVIENIALLKMLDGSTSPLLAPLAFWCALPKLFVTLWLIVPFLLGVIFISAFVLLRQLLS